MTTTPVDTVEIAEQLTCCAEALDGADQCAQLALFRLLAGGEPVEPTRLAAQTGLETSDVLARLGRGHGAQTDADARIVAFQGLSLIETPHRLRVDGRTVYAWCAWDTLFLPELIGRPAQIESRCPTTGERISLRLGPRGRRRSRRRRPCSRTWFRARRSAITRSRASGPSSTTSPQGTPPPSGPNNIPGRS